MAGRVMEMATADLWRRREEILRSVGLTYDELRRRATDHALVGDEWDAWEEISELDYLLKRDDA